MLCNYGVSNEVKFRHQTALCSKCSILLDTYLDLSLIYRKKNFLLPERCFCHGPTGFNFTCPSCIICYHATQIVEMFHILPLFLKYHNLYCGRLPLDSHYLTFFPIHLHYMSSSNLKYSTNFHVLGYYNTFVNIFVTVCILVPSVEAIS